MSDEWQWPAKEIAKRVRDREISAAAVTQAALDRLAAVNPRINAVVAMKNAEALGVVSQTDVVLARQGRSREDAQNLPVGDVMTDGCITCDIDAPLTDAISTMTKLKIHPSISLICAHSCTCEKFRKSSTLFLRNR